MTLLGAKNISSTYIQQRPRRLLEDLMMNMHSPWMLGVSLVFKAKQTRKFGHRSWVSTFDIVEVLFAIVFLFKCLLMTLLSFPPGSSGKIPLWDQWFCAVWHLSLDGPSLHLQMLVLRPSNIGHDDLRISLAFFSHTHKSLNTFTRALYLSLNK